MCFRTDFFFIYLAFNFFYFLVNGGFESRKIFYKFVLNITNIIKMESLEIPHILYFGRLADNSSKGGKGFRRVSVFCLGLDFCVARSEWNFVARD